MYLYLLKLDFVCFNKNELKGEHPHAWTLSCESDLAECTHSTDLIIKCTASLCVALFLMLPMVKFSLCFVLALFSFNDDQQPKNHKEKDAAPK